MARYNIDNVEISITNIHDALNRINEQIRTGKSAYICVTNSRAAYIGHHDEQYREVLNNSLMTVPDGKPLEWIARLSGFKDVKRTSGSDLFRAICNLSLEKGYSHYFYGSTSEVLTRLVTNTINEFPGIRILGAISPPFGSAEVLANQLIIDSINKHKPTFVWIGLGAPKQERFMHLICSQVESSILIGVGLVFDYQAGTVIRAPKWMQRNGLEWAYRLAQQPGNIRRAIKPLAWISYKIIVSLFK